MLDYIRELAVLATAFHTHVHRAKDMSATRIVKLLEELDAFRRPERFNEFLQVAECDFHGRLLIGDKEYTQPKILRQALAVANEVDVDAIASSVKRKEFVPDRVHAERVSAVKRYLDARFYEEHQRKFVIIHATGWIGVLVGVVYWTGPCYWFQIQLCYPYPIGFSDW